MADVDNSVGVIYKRRTTSSGTDSDQISPRIKDAMDRIFPKSPSKFLQNPFPDKHDMILAGNQHPSSNLPVSVSTVLDVNQPLACTVSNAHITTDTTTTATAIFTGLTTSSGTKSPIMSSVPTYSNDMPSLPAPAIVKNIVSEQNGISLPQPKIIPKAKISLSDLQICTQVITESPKSTISDKVCSDSDSKSERTNFMKEKKRKKKRKKHHLKEISNNGSELSLVDSASNGCNLHASQPQINPLSNGEVNTLSDVDSTILCRPPVKVQQKLPKVLRCFIDIGKDYKYIKKKFLPCYVVMKNISGIDSEESLEISLSSRVKHLSELCAKNVIDCPKFKSLHYKNIFEECLIQNSEDEFISPRGRSLRKRNQNVSYVEPSEDDLLEEFSSVSKRKKAQIKAAEEHQKTEEPKEHSVTNVVDEKKSESEQKDKSNKKKAKSKDQSEETHQNYNTPDVDQSKTGTAHTGMKDDRGRSLVYVFPKSSVQNKEGKGSGKNKDGKSTSPIKKIGPASKTNQPLNLSSLTSLTTLSLPRSLLSGNITVRGMPNISTTSHQAVPSLVQPPPSTATATSSPSFYMVKIDGKDFLVPVMAGSTPPRPGIPVLPNAQTLLTRAPTQSLAAQPFAVNRLPSVMIPGIPSGVRMLSPTLSTNNVPSSVPYIGTPPQATSCIPISGLSQIGLVSNRPPQLIPSSLLASTVTRPLKSTAITSLVRTALATSVNPTASSISQPSSISQSILATNISTLGTSTIVAPLAAPASTTVLRSTRPRTVTTTTTAPVVSNTTATGTRCFRIIVPGCSATGVPARIATLGSQANNSPLTHMALSSSLLPQRKRSGEKEISPEKRAAKRRRLEKKYPLPPGVVIKTEPDEVPPPTTTTVQSVRSLLGQNIQLITSAARSGSAPVQNIRLVSPLSGTRQMRLGANFIIRAPNSSTVLSSGSLSALACSASSLIVNSATPSCISLSTVSRSIDCISVNATLPSSTATSTTNTTTPAFTKSTTATSSISLSTLATSTSSAHDKITTLSYSVSSKNSITSSSASSKERATPSLDSLKGSIDGLRKLINTQENVGLKGPRLDKLKEILAQKEKALTELGKEQIDSQAPLLSGISALDPVVID